MLGRKTANLASPRSRETTRRTASERTAKVVFLNCCARALDRDAKLIAIDKEANHGVMHEHGLGETDCFAGESLEPCAQRQMFAFDLLRVDFADAVGRSGEVTVIDPCRIGIKMD